MQREEKKMSRKLVSMYSGALLTLLVGLSAGVSEAGVNYTLRADTETPGEYVVYVKSDTTVHGKPYNMVLGGQVTLVLPDGAIPTPVGGGTSYKVTDNGAVAGVWEGQDVSQDVGAPDIRESRADVFQVILGLGAPEVNLTAGAELELFRFQVSGVCEGELRLLSNQEPFGADKPNSRYLASANVYETLDGEQYLGNYDQHMAPCPQ